MLLYRLLLRLYPASFRAEYGEEMAAIFAARRRQSGRPAAGLWAEAVRDIVANAARIHVDILRQDLRYTVRTLARAPGFTATVILVSAIGIGATTAAVALADHVLIRPLPFADPDRLVKLWQDQTFRGFPRMELSPPNYADWKQLSTSFQSMSAYTTWSVSLTGQGDPERLDGVATTPDTFTTLGVRAALGRVLGPADEGAGAERTIVLSDRVWRSLFNADPGIVGRKIVLDGAPHTVAGVMSPNFHFPSRDTEFWTPLRFEPRDFVDRRNTYLYSIARLRPGVTLDEARAEMALVTKQLERAYPKENAQTSAAVHLLRDQVSAQARQMLLALVGAALCVLLIACSNLANLVLARAVGRQRELAVRMAIGAGPERLIRQMLTESLLLAAAGGIAGIWLATAAAPLVARLVPTTLPIADAPSLDLRLVVAAAIVTVATGIGFGIVPALRLRRSTDFSGLREGARTGAGHRTERLRSVLVSAEVAACVVLLVSAGLLVRALWRVQNVDPGFRAEGVLTLRTTLPMPKYEATGRRAQFYRSVLDGVRQLPGVANAAYISFLPMVMRGGIWSITTDGRPENPAESRSASLRFVSPGFFATLGIPLRLGRDVAETDTETSPFVAVVSESFVRQHWPGHNPLGRRFLVAFRERTVVGVVADIRVRGLERTSEPQVYLPYEQVPDRWLLFYAPKDLVVKAAVPAESLAPAISGIVHKFDAQQPVSDVRTLAAIVDADTGSRQTQVRALAGLAIVAFVLAALGIHGLLAFSVSAQLREIGIRVALGARRSSIVAMVLRRTAVLTGAGVAAGAALAYAAGRGMQALLFGVSPADATTFAAAVALAAVMALLGSLLPAVHAVRADPLAAMKVD